MGTSLEGKKGCKHDPENACGECIRALGDGTAVLIEPKTADGRPAPLPQEGESLQQYLDRCAALGTEVNVTQRKPGELTDAEARLAIRDPNVPEVIRRYWRERIYGKGGAGRKSIQQERLTKQQNSLVENLGLRAMEKVQESVGATPSRLDLRALSGRQRKIARRILRRGAKIVQNAK